MWTTLREFNTARYRVALQWQYDADADVRDLDEETRAAVCAEELAVYCFRVAVWHDGREVAADYLGDSVYADPADFGRQHYGIAPKGRADGVTYCVYFPSMVREAIRETRITLLKTKTQKVRGDNHD